MQRTQHGFTLIELMIVVAIIGILAAIALPSYQDYTVRAKVSELILAGSAYRNQVAENYMVNGDATTAGNGITVTPVGKVTAGAVSAGGVITIQGSTASTSVGRDVVVTLTPTFDANTKSVSWECSGSPAKYAPATCRGTAVSAASASSSSSKNGSCRSVDAVTAAVGVLCCRRPSGCVASSRRKR